MKKNDITYEYRVFTNRLIDVESMEVGNCTSKVIKEIKSKDKVDGRFFHTSDTDEWFFCWNGELQKLNLKGDADVNNALAEVRELINEAEKAVEDAKNTASEAAKAAADAQKAADAAGDAVESIENKADVSYVDNLIAQEVAVKADKTAVDALTTTVAGKADASVVDALDAKVNSKADKSELDSKATIDSVNSLTELVAGKADSADVKDLSDKVAAIKLDDYALKVEVPSIEGLATENFVGEKIAEIEFPKKVSEFENDAEYLTVEVASSMFAPIGSEGGDMSGYATTKYVDDAIEVVDAKIPNKVSELENDANYLTAHQDISGKQDVIEDLDDIRANAALGATALQEVPAEYVTDAELTGKGYLTAQSLGDYALKSEIPSLDGYAKTTDIPSMDDYYTKGEIDGKIDAINAMLGEAINITNTILA